VRYRSLVIALAWVVLAASAIAAEDARFPAVERIVAFGDVHGAYDALTALLRQVEVVDDRLDWSGGTTHLVSLGDLLDRGPDSRRVLDLLMNLEPQAAAAGGRLHLVLGNHEVMNLTGDLRYVSAAEYAAFAADGAPVLDVPAGAAALRAAFAPDGRYGAWLRDKPALVVIGETVFVHGGLSPLVEVGERPVNARLRAVLASAVDELALESEPLFGELGPFWYRGNALCHVLLEAPVVERALAALGARRVVVGHTPTASRRVESRLSGRVLMVDTGMLAEAYRGIASALVIEGEKVSVVEAGRPDRGEPRPTAGAYSGNFAARDALALAFASAPVRASTPVADIRGAVDLDFDGVGGVVRGRLLPIGRAAAQRELAAYELDRLLGLGIVRAVALRSIGGRSGVVVEHPTHLRTERERLAAGRGRAQPCAEGSDVALLHAFVFLTGHRSLTADEVGYDRQTGDLRVWGFGDAFGRDARGTAMSVPTGPLRERLAALDAAGLAATGLGAREIHALLERRDRLLAAVPGGE
jgi:hypothetical protein